MTADTITAIKKALEVADTLQNYTDIDAAEGANSDVVAASYAAVKTIEDLDSTLESLQRENEVLRAALTGLVSCHDDFNASSANMEEAYYKLAKYAHPQWQAARAALSSTGDTHGN